jgi:protein SCO1/2
MAARASVLAVLLAATAAVGCGSRESTPGAAAGRRAASLPDLGFGGDFELVATDGRPFRLSDVHDRVVLLFFGYTSCPDVCPTTLGAIARAKRELGAGGERILPVFVTVDPERDTPAELARYLAHFEIGAVGLTGTKTQIDAAARLFRVRYSVEPSDSAMGPLITHTAYVFLVDRRGRVRHRFHPNEPAEALAGVLRPVLEDPRLLE